MKSFTCYLLLAVAITCSVVCDAEYMRTVSRVGWRGVAFFVEAPRKNILQKLDEWHESNLEKDPDAPRLSLPNYKVFPELLSDESYPVYIDIGYLSATDFEESDGYDNSIPPVSKSGLEVAVTIPLLTGESDPNGSPLYALTLAKFYIRGRGDIPRPNIVYPYIAVDYIEMNEDGGFIVDGDDYFVFSYTKKMDPCVPPYNTIVHDFQEFVDEDFQLGTGTPHFSFCEQHTEFASTQFCDIVSKIKDDVEASGSNICQSWRSTNQIHCDAEVQVLAITQGFRDFILVGSDPIRVVEAEASIGDYSIGLKYPCVE